MGIFYNTNWYVAVIPVSVGQRQLTCRYGVYSGVACSY
jgi:hypothetical protein